MVSQNLIDEFQTRGFTIVRSLFSPEECDRFSGYFTAMVERGGDGWAEGDVDPHHPDPLKRYPRLLQPHRGDKVAFDYMVDPRVRQHLTAFAGSEPYAVQTMVYFKAPGARGQNLHQDNMFLQVSPGTCLASWLALDDCDEENGCMMLVPNSGGLPIICQVSREGLDHEQWNNWETPLPPGYEAVPALMKRGDVLFFNGNVIHGSYRNRSQDRFRRTLIGHYIAAEAKEVAKYYFPVFRMDGRELTEGVETAVAGGPCGVYESGEFAMTGHHSSWESPH